MGLKGLRAERREHAIRLILASATEVFAEQGYNGTSMDDIARRVDCAPATLYGYFKGKEKIFSRIFEEKSAEYLRGVEETLAQDRDFTAALDAYIAHFAGSVSKNADFVRLLVAVLRSHDVGAFPGGEQHAEQHLRYIGLLASLMQRGIDEGALSPRPPEFLAIAFLGMVHTAFYSWMLGGADAPFDPLMDHVRALFLHGAASEVDR